MSAASSPFSLFRSRELLSACDRALNGVNLDDDVRDVREHLLLLTRRLSVRLRYGAQRGNGQPLAAAEQIVLGRERRSLDAPALHGARLPLSIRTPAFFSSRVGMIRRLISLVPS